MTEPIEGTALDEGFDGAFIQNRGGHLLDEVVERFEGSARLARLANGLHHPHPDISDGSQAKPYVITHSAESGNRLVHIGRENLDSHAPTFVEVDSRLVFLITHTGQERGHIFGWIVSFEVGRPVGNHSVRSGVGLIERVIRERDQDLPERPNGVIRKAVRAHTLSERFKLNIELFLLLFPHRTAEQIGLSQCVAGEFLGYFHDLFLIHNQSVGLAEDLLESRSKLRVQGGDVLLTIFSQCVVGVGISSHGSRAIQRQDRRNILEALRLQETQQTPHRPTIELEDTQSVSPAQQGIGGFVIERKLLQGGTVPSVELDVVQSVVNDGEVSKRQEIHFDQSERL